MVYYGPLPQPLPQPDTPSGSFTYAFATKALNAETANLHTETEKAKKDWDTRQPQFDEAVKHVEELEAWEDPKAKLLRTLVDGIRKQAANTRRRPRPSMSFCPSSSPLTTLT